MNRTELSGGGFRAEKSDVSLQRMTQVLTFCGSDDRQGSKRSTSGSWRQSGSEKKGSGLIEKVIDNLGMARNKSASGAKGFSQRAHL
jgi:hypothetical protein